MLVILELQEISLSHVQITTGEGGAIITNDKNYLKLKKLKAFGIDTDIERKNPGEYDTLWV